MSPRLSSLLLGLGAAASLGACASLPEPAPHASSHADRHPIAVEQTGERLEIDISGEGGLTAKARDDIARFAGGYLRYGHGALILSTPSGSSNADAATLVAQQARLALVHSGVHHAAVASSTYDASGAPDAPVVLSFARYEAQAPECAPLYTQNLSPQSNNQPWESFGCATQANLAAMIEDPRDLIGPRPMDARDSGRRDVIMSDYREGNATATQRTADERASISTVAQ